MLDNLPLFSESLNHSAERAVADCSRNNNASYQRYPGFPIQRKGAEDYGEYKYSDEPGDTEKY